MTEPSRRVFGTESELALEYIDGNHLDETTVSDRDISRSDTITLHRLARVSLSDWHRESCHAECA